jgi:hypothetical protein
MQSATRTHWGRQRDAEEPQDDRARCGQEGRVHQQLLGSFLQLHHAHFDPAAAQDTWPASAPDFGRIRFDAAGHYVLRKAMCFSMGWTKRGVQAHCNHSRQFHRHVQLQESRGARAHLLAARAASEAASTAAAHCHSSISSSSLLSLHLPACATTAGHLHVAVASSTTPGWKGPLHTTKQARRSAVPSAPLLPLG